MNGALLPLGALAAGFVSASSPCVLPVIPGYLAAVSGDAGAGGPGRRTSMRGAAGFVAGFTVVFTVLGATASAIGGLLYEQLDRALQIAGFVLIAFGLHTIGIARWRRLGAERRLVPLHTIATGPHRSIALGAAFALGWTPCIGPILATILTKAAADASLAQGVVLLLLYSLGLGVPFLAIAAWFERSARQRRWLARRSVTLQRVGGGVMIIAGVAYLSGAWTAMFQGTQRQLARFGWPPI